jgi:hypothetical protein
VRLNAKMSNNNSYSSEGEGNSGYHRAEQIRHSWQNSWQSSWQSRQEIEDELRTQLLREVKTEVDKILKEMEDIKLENKRIKNENRDLTKLK